MRSFRWIFICGGVIFGIFLSMMAGRFFSDDQNLSLAKEQKTLLFDIVVPLDLNSSESDDLYTDDWHSYEYGVAYQAIGLDEADKNKMKQIFSGFDLIKDGKNETVSYYSGFSIEIFVEDKDIHYIVRMYNVDNILFEVERVKKVDGKRRIWTFPEYGAKRLFSDERLGTEIRRFMKDRKDKIDNKVGCIDPYVLPRPWWYYLFDRNWWGGSYLSGLRDNWHSEKINEKEAAEKEAKK